MAANLFYEGEFRALNARKLTEETCRKFGYKVGKLFDGRTVQLAPYYDAEGTIVGTKVRPADKDGMFSTGDMGNVLLFGQQLWERGGKKVVVTEGEIDCMTVSQVQNNKWPVVSIPKGTSNAKKDIARNLDWLCSFDEVILMFDTDEPHTRPKTGEIYYPGQDAAKECAQLFPPGKCKIATLPMKDPSDMLQAGQGSKIVDAIWQAKSYRPDGVVKISDIKAKILTPPSMGLPWFTPRLTELTYGRRWGELYAFGAGTGIGKTDFLTQQIKHDVMVLGQKVGLFMLEQQPDETAKRVAGKFAGKTFHIPDDTWTAEELAEVIDRLERDDNLFFYDNFGATDWDVIASTIRYLAHSEGVRIFYLDHLTALAAAAEDERKELERVMAEMAALAKELNIIIHLVSHLATPEGKPHEEGGRVMIRHFKGSRAIGFWCHYMFGLERDQQHEDERWRSITVFRVLKDRYTGRATGEVVYLGYDRDTGTLYETEPPDEAGGHGFSDATKTPAMADDCPF
ncbi:DnaB-like helicase C-terminal domain-containing protein [Labrys neptuniae]